MFKKRRKEIRTARKRKSLRESKSKRDRKIEVDIQKEGNNTHDNKSRCIEKGGKRYVQGERERV